MPVEADLLLPAETLLDLYGEDIRARAEGNVAGDDAVLEVNEIGA